MKTKNPMHKAYTRLTRAIVVVFALVLTAGFAQAQVTVSISDVSGRPGETVTVPVEVSGATLSSINSFGFTVNTPAGITFTGVETAGTLTSSWASVSENLLTGVVGGFGSAISTDGTLLNLVFEYDDPYSGTDTVTLTDLQISGADVADQGFDFTVTERFMSVGSQSVVIDRNFELSVEVEDALVSGDAVNAFNLDISYDPAVMTIDKTQGNGGVITTGTLTASNWTVTLNDVGGEDSGTLRVAGFGSTLTGEGTFFKVAFTAVGAGTSTSEISNVDFQPGPVDPPYGLLTGTTTVTLNQAPVATAGTLAVDEDASGSVTLTGTDGNGDPLTFALASQPTNGSVTLSGDVATYTPDANFNGTDSFTFTANDGTDDSAAATVSVTVNAVNDAPVVADASATTDEDTAVDIALAGTDVEGDALTYSVATAPSNGSVTIVGSTATYTPNAEYSGSDSFTITANDGTDDSAAATVSVTVNAVNDAPVVADASATTDEDTAVDIALVGTDVEGDALTYSVATAPSNGSVTIAGSTATYTPNADYNGADSFTVTANDGTDDSAAATVSVTVNAVNDAPVAADASATTAEGSSIAFSLSATDVDGNDLTYSVATAPANGSVTIDGSMATYSPNVGFNGMDSFTFVANDGTVDSAPATATITVTQVNDAPLANDIAAVTIEDTALSITLAGSDADGDAVTFAAATQPANGILSGTAPNMVYTPNADFNGTDSFTYTANDGMVDSTPATVTITVVAVNDVPVAADATASTTEDTAVDVTLSATDVDGDELTYTATDGANGTVSVAGATATYMPAANFNGTDTFTFVANDGTVDSAPATVTVTVGMVNDVPVVADVTLTVEEDMAGELTLSATDNDGDAVTFTVTDPTNGTVALDGDKVTYTPAANFNGTDSFTYTANDGTADSAAGTVSVTVNSVNDAPVFTVEMPDVMIAEDNGLLSFTYEATDVDGDTLTFSIAGEPAGATFDASTGAFSVDPMGKAGVYTIIGSVSDGTVTVDATAATVTIYGVNMRSANLAGVHEVGPVATPGSGMVWARLVEDANTLEVWGSFADLSGDYAASHIHLGVVGQNGGAAITLTATPDADNRGGSWSVGDNTFDVSGNADLVAAIKDGGAYVNVHTSAFAAGEIRGQILSSMNAAPAAATSLAPSLVNVAGDPEATAFAVSWLPVADPDGDRISYLFQTATDENFSSNVEYVDFGQTNGIAFTVADAAELYDALADLDPFSVEVGGSQTFYHRVITTDGSLWTAGPGAETSLRRGQVTDTELGSELPTEFALKGNYPNPFNPSTNIRFDLPETADVSVIVVDLLGRQVLSVPPETFEAGAGKTILLDASALSSGIYMYQVRSRTQSGMDVMSGTMTLIK